jgi:uncharacterized protein (DUF736 family)
MLRGKGLSPQRGLPDLHSLRSLQAGRYPSAPRPAAIEASQCDGTASRLPMGRSQNRRKEKTMTTIAKLTKQQDGRLVGTLTTLALHVAKITFAPEQSDNEKAPAYRAFAGDFEIGAGWKKTSKAGKPYISVKLDNPSFSQPIYCVLVKAEGSLYLLDWNRQAPRRQQKAADANEISF